MALGIGTPDVATVKQNVRKGAFTLYAKECDPITGAPLTTGDGTIWQPIGYTKGTAINRLTAAYKETDDTGNAVVNMVTLDSWEIPFTLLERRAAVRELFENAEGHSYQVVAQGADIGTLTEYHAFAICNFVGETSYAIGENGQTTGGKIVTVSNSASITVTPPTTLTASTLTIPIGRMGKTSDLVHA